VTHLTTRPTTACAIAVAEYVIIAETRRMTSRATIAIPVVVGVVAALAVDSSALITGVVITATRPMTPRATIAIPVVAVVDAHIVVTSAIRSRTGAVSPFVTGVPRDSDDVTAAVVATPPPIGAASFFVIKMRGDSARADRVVDEITIDTARRPTTGIFRPGSSRAPLLSRSSGDG
jgi:hypothetical protein